MQVSALPATQKKEEPTEAGTWEGICDTLTQAGVADVAEVCYLHVHSRMLYLYLHMHTVA